MIDCEETLVLLGAFQDGELTPHEMQQVARHLAGCSACELALEDYRSIGSMLRDVIAEPALDGFATAVQARIARIHIPFRTRVAGYFAHLGEGIGAAVAMGAAAAAAAVLTIVLVTPYARSLANHNSPSTAVTTAQGHDTANATIAIASNNKANEPRVATGELRNPASHAPMVAAASENVLSAETDDIANDSKAIISRLETDSPSVAVWSEPRTDTTVIWVPGQQP